ncbi:hypothetical protein ACFX2H_003716 [Malus domestica]
MGEKPSRAYSIWSRVASSIESFAASSSSEKPTMVASCKTFSKRSDVQRVFVTIPTVEMVNKSSAVGAGIIRRKQSGGVRSGAVWVL